jgi:hypothetical protein
MCSEDYGMSGFFICPHCEAKVPANARACPECGSDEQTGWSKSPAAGGIFTDNAERGGRFASTGLKLVAIGLLVLVVLGTASTVGRRGSIVLPILLIVVVITSIVLSRRPTLKRGLGREQQLYASLLNKAHGDQALAGRLIDYEQRRTPNAPREQLIQSAIYRWDRDNR